jgi:RNA polymerase sigma factor (sigma-70 family)
MAANMRSSPPPDPGASAPEPSPANDVDEALPPDLTPSQGALVKLGLPEVGRCAADVARRFHGRFTPEDLLASGTLGLLVAARVYDEERGLGFAHFARYYILGRMLNAVEAELFSIRARVEHAMERAFCGFSAHQVLDVDLFADPEEKLVDGARLGCDDVLAAAIYGAIAEAAETERASPEDALLQHVSLRDALATLYPHERQVIQLVYEEGMILVDVADHLGIHTNTAHNRHASALRKLRAFLLDRGRPGRR